MPTYNENLMDALVPEPTMAPTAYYPGCFPRGEMVRLESGQAMGIERVRVGDRVLAVDVATGASSFANVVSVPHPYNILPSEYILITTQSGRDLRLTPDHLLPLGPCGEWSPHSHQDMFCLCFLCMRL